jgi:predicted phosphodiesterase
VKLALISDVHANLEALRATLDDIAAQAVDRIVCLGDIVGYNANPAECIALIRRADCLCVAGNHVAPSPATTIAPSAGAITTETFSTTAARAAAWTRRRLKADDLAFLAGLPLTAEIEGELVAVHGALHPQAGREIVNDDESRGFTFEALLTHPSGARICAFGHTHRAAIYELRDGRVMSWGEDELRLRDDAYYLINPGTVGEPRGTDRRARYMVVDLARRSVRRRRVVYDAVAPVRATRQAGLAPLLPFVSGRLRQALKRSLRALGLEAAVRERLAPRPRT